MEGNDVSNFWVTTAHVSAEFGLAGPLGSVLAIVLDFKANLLC